MLQEEREESTHQKRILMQLVQDTQTQLNSMFGQINQLQQQYSNVQQWKPPYDPTPTMQKSKQQRNPPPIPNTSTQGSDNVPSEDLPTSSADNNTSQASQPNQPNLTEVMMDTLKSQQRYFETKSDHGEGSTFSKFGGKSKQEFKLWYD